MKNILNKLSLLMVAMTLVFAGCEDDFGPEHDRGNNGGGSGGGAATGTINGHDYVDLGLPSGLKWATCNVGAATPEDYGNYYAWGETTTKTSYDQSVTYGQQISDFSGNPTYDAARANWGSSWRMPTIAEMQELENNCTWTWTTQNGVNGYKVTGTNGNSIFLPAAGYCRGSSRYNVGLYGNIWSSTPEESVTDFACSLRFGSDYHEVYWFTRSCGLTVRPVSGTINYGTEELPTVTTNSVTSITKNSAVCGGNVTSDGGATVTRRGVCWSTSSNPTVYDNKTIDGNGEGSFSSNITELEAGTTYYVRAYATNSEGTAYGTQKTFTTTTTSGGGATTGTINGHDWVDLGLPSGLKWATCNVGASQPHGYGNYYAWGETTTKSSYTEENSRTYGVIMNDISGNVNYDAARANWGSTWRMPTKAEMKELRDNCTWTWTTQNGINGYKVTGQNGKSIFLPAAGSCHGSSRYYVGVGGTYWGSTPDESNDCFACTLTFDSGVRNVSWLFRDSGYTVRPVSD